MNKKENIKLKKKIFKKINSNKETYFKEKKLIQK